MSSQCFKRNCRNKPDHSQTTIQLFGMHVKPKLRLFALDVGHLRLNCEDVHQALIINVRTSSHGVLQKAL